VTDFRLSDAVDAAEALFEAVGVPGQVVVDHQVSALQVDALTGGVGGHEDFHFLVVGEALLGLLAVLAAHAAVNRDDRLGLAEERADPLGQVVQGVAVLGEDDEFAAVPGGVEHFRVVLEQAGQLVPFLIGVRLPHLQGRRFEALEHGDFGLQLGDGAGRGRLIDHALLGFLHLGVGSVFEVVESVRVVGGQAGGQVEGDRRSALEELFFPKALLQALAAAAERLRNGFRRRGPPPLQDGEREANRALLSATLQCFGPVEFLADVVGHLLAQHLAVDGGDLVGEWLDQRGVDGQQGVEEVRQGDAVGLGQEPEHGPVAVKTPRPSLDGNFERRLPVAVKQLVPQGAGRRLVGQFHGDRSDPLHVDHCDEAVGKDAFHGSPAREILQACHERPPPAGEAVKRPRNGDRPTAWRQCRQVVEPGVRMLARSTAGCTETFAGGLHPLPRGSEP